jgi:mRNA-degrading endonuclease RelE of RelBE toxin-antitoxin system
MTGYRARIRPRPAEVIRRLPPDVKRAVRAAIGKLLSDPAAGEPLHDELRGLGKYRVRRYRLVYRVDRGARVIDILAVGERRTIYEEVADLLRSEEQ